jgi:hypothetical protein
LEDVDEVVEVVESGVSSLIAEEEEEVFAVTWACFGGNTSGEVDLTEEGADLGGGDAAEKVGFGEEESAGAATGAAGGVEPADIEGFTGDACLAGAAFGASGCFAGEETGSVVGFERVVASFFEQ